jgi:hypothetical protein
MATYSKSGIEMLSIYGDMVSTQLWLLAARNRVYNTCNATDPSRLKPEQIKAILESADQIYNIMFKKAKELIEKLDAAVQAAAYKKGSTAELYHARSMCKKIHALNRNTMKAICFLTHPAIPHLGEQPSDEGSVITPAMNPKQLLDVDDYVHKLKAAAKDLS